MCIDLDVLTSQQRSRCMSSIRSKNTKPEILLRKALWAKGLRYRLHFELPGRPDLVFKKNKLAVFCDGCFWHRCPKHFNLPATNTVFWLDKISRNVERDKKVNIMLKDMGWTVLRFWEHEINEDLDAVVSQVLKTLAGGSIEKE